MLIHIVTAANRQLYGSQLEQMHRLRWRIYIEERGWRALREKQPEAGYERDEYDDERAHYLLAIDDAGAVLGAMRMRPADDRSLLADHFAHLLESKTPPLFGPDVWELTRLLRAPLNRSRDGAVRYAMNCALIEFCLSRGVSRLIATGDTFLLPMTRKAWGSKVRPLGLPQPYDEGEVIALELFPDADALAAMRAAGAVLGEQLYDHPSPLRARDPDPIVAARLAAAARGDLREARERSGLGLPSSAEAA
ncbi:MAG TPA: acyl-homoserine-lactone synthase [Vitreimonas sp.]|uniref:acyl-homoserine-lactone synthase n=1 Tax=Vitreimonas sp. TaxID=3069702 RepID=UPI002D6951F9|nr:acyl-homoserine-lactone synthase [Vitreimonas sp.]HYD86035.1 acyl-homoserine-lactone synthase [Vitreimonas sp.]